MKSNWHNHAPTKQISRDIQTIYDGTEGTDELDIDNGIPTLKSPIG